MRSFHYLNLIYGLILLLLIVIFNLRMIDIGKNALLQKKEKKR